APTGPATGPRQPPARYAPARRKRQHKRVGRKSACPSVSQDFATPAVEEPRRGLAIPGNAEWDRRIESACFQGPLPFGPKRKRPEAPPDGPSAARGHAAESSSERASTGH